MTGGMTVPEEELDMAPHAVTRGGRGVSGREG